MSQARLSPRSVRFLNDLCEADVMDGWSESGIVHTCSRLRPQAYGFRTALVNFRIASIIR